MPRSVCADVQTREVEPEDLDLADHVVEVGRRDVPAAALVE
jgi:hypothetical protein